MNLTLMQMLPNPSPVGAGVPQFGHILLASIFLTFLSIASASAPDILFIF
jgi:hypothetical protein